MGTCAWYIVMRVQVLIGPIPPGLMGKHPHFPPNLRGKVPQKRGDAHVEEHIKP